jgi:hypothetical protein
MTTTKKKQKKNLTYLTVCSVHTVADAFAQICALVLAKIKTWTDF